MGAAAPGASATALATVSVSVQNGGGIKGRGAAMVSHVVGLGLHPGTATNAKDTSWATTVVFFAPGHEDEAARVHKSLGVGKAPGLRHFRGNCKLRP